MQNRLLRAYILAYILLRVGEDAGLIACILRTNICRIAMQSAPYCSTICMLLLGNNVAIAMQS